VTALTILATIAGLSMLRGLLLAIIRADEGMHRRWVARLEADLDRERKLFTLHEEKAQR
jgi:hypothetical protein